MGLNTKGGSSNRIIPCFATLEKAFRHQRQNISKFCWSSNSNIQKRKKISSKNGERFGTNGRFLL